MAHRGCVNGVLDDTRYSSPVPVIGLYIGGATLLCLGLMVSDILEAYRARRKWLPCKLFSLNSTTLTLLSIVAKLPVDLTSSMPSAQDQLSKLTSTALICIAMGFFMPSIGIYKEPECVGNMVALSIFVVTVVVNVCMQMYTGVIYLFTAEHMILICCMLGLLIMLWFMVRATTRQKKHFVDLQKDLIQKGKPSMLRRLKMCYVYGFNANPQFVPCKDPHSGTIGFLCMISLLVVIQAAIRSLVFNIEFCQGTSDYGFSMWMILVSQIFAIIVGCSATSFRWLTMVNQMHGHKFGRSFQKEEAYVNPVLGIIVRDVWKDLCELSLRMGDFIMVMVVLIPATAVNQLVKRLCASCLEKNREGRVIEEFKDMNYGDMGLDEWTLQKSVKEMILWMDVSKRDSLHHLSQLLHKTPPSQQLHTVDLKDQIYLDEGIEVSLLTMVLLLRIAVVSMPPLLVRSLMKTFHEAFETINFINDRTNFLSVKNKEKSGLAKLVWKAREFHILLPIIFGKSSPATTDSLSDLDRALVIIRGLKSALPSDVLWDEVGVITDFITRRSYSSIEDLYKYVEQLLVDMLHLFLSELPIVIYNEVTESPPEQYEERVIVCLKFLWKIQPLEAIVQWKFPVGSNITSLATLEHSFTETEIGRLEDYDESSVSQELV